MTTIDAINTDSTPESRAEAESLITNAVRRELATALAKLHAEKGRAQRLEIERDELRDSSARIAAMLPTVTPRGDLADGVLAAIAESERLRNASIAAENGARNRVAELHADLRHIAKLAGVRVDGLGDSVLAQRATIAVTQIVEGLTASRAYCDSLDSKLTAVRNELTAAGVPDDQDVDGRRCALNEPARVEMLRAQRDTARDSIAAHGPLRAEADKLRARPVLTEAAVRLAITSKRTGEEGPRIGTPATIYAQLTEGGPVTIRSQTLTSDVLHAAMGAAIAEAEAKGWRKAGWSISAADIMAKLGAVTLPAQDRGKDLARAYVDEHTKIAALVKAGDFSWHPSGYKGTWHSEVGAMMQEVAMSRALASLGAPATTPSKPADVFAGVSIDELVRISADAYVTAVDAPGRAGITAVLDALRVRMVAPVDPEMIAAEITRPVAAVVRVSEWKAVKAAARTALDSRGIPVTPEAAK